MDRGRRSRQRQQPQAKGLVGRQPTHQRTGRLRDPIHNKSILLDQHGLRLPRPPGRFDAPIASRVPRPFHPANRILRVNEHPPPGATLGPMSRSGATYHVGSPTRICAATGRPLATGEPYVAALVQVPDAEEFQRVDFSLEAWKQGARPRTPEGRRLAVLGSWRGVIPEPGAKRRILIDDESLLDLFEQTGDEGPPPEAGAEVATEADRRAFRFLLALILMRKKLLICERTDRSGAMHVRPRGSPKSSEGGVLTVVEDPGLDEEAIARVVVQLQAVLDGDAPGAAPSTPSAPPAKTGTGE